MSVTLPNEDWKSWNGVNFAVSDGELWVLCWSEESGAFWIHVPIKKEDSK